MADNIRDRNERAQELRRQMRQLNASIREASASQRRPVALRRLTVIESRRDNGAHGNHAA